MFLCYPLIICGINKVGIIKEKNKIIGKLETAGCEAYSSKTFVYTEMEYYRGYRILYHAEYVIIFKSDMSLEELNEKFQFVCILEDAEHDSFTDSEKIMSARLPDNTDGYYALWFPPYAAVNETGGTKLHTYLYADKENRGRIENELSYFE